MAPMSDYRKHPDYVAERRKIVMAHHPDRGGDAGVLLEQLRRLDARWERRDFIRRQVHDNRPSFISEEQATKALDTTEQVVRRAGRLAGTVQRTIREKITEEFRKGRDGG